MSLSFVRPSLNFSHFFSEEFKLWCLSLTNQVRVLGVAVMSVLSHESVQRVF